MGYVYLMVLQIMFWKPLRMSREVRLSLLLKHIGAIQMPQNVRDLLLMMAVLIHMFGADSLN